jgi:hypothetical protein
MFKHKISGMPLGTGHTSGGPDPLDHGILYICVLQMALYYELEQVSKIDILRKLNQRFGAKRSVMLAFGSVDPAASAVHRGLDELTSLYLSIALFCVKPANMKPTPSGTLRVAALVALGVATVITLRALAQSPASSRDPEVNKFVLKIKKNSGEHHKLKHQADSKEEEDFKTLLCNGHYDSGSHMYLRHEDGTASQIDLPKDCGSSSSRSQLNIKTDKVTVSHAAESAADSKLTVIGPHVTIQVASTSTDDIKAVLDRLEPKQ